MQPLLFKEKAVRGKHPRGKWTHFSVKKVELLSGRKLTLPDYSTSPGWSSWMKDWPNNYLERRIHWIRWSLLGITIIASLVLRSKCRNSPTEPLRWKCLDGQYPAGIWIRTGWNSKYCRPCAGCETDQNRWDRSCSKVTRTLYVRQGDQIFDSILEETTSSRNYDISHRSHCCISS